eukprot:SAG11_NODE_501_length_8895_cov_12.129832_2_plen_260_part_00
MKNVSKYVVLLREREREREQNRHWYRKTYAPRWGARSCSLGTGTCLIVGYGEVGKRVGAVCLALGMRVLATSRTAPPRSAGSLGLGDSGRPDVGEPRLEVELHPLDSLTELLRVATHVVLACPLTPLTKGIVGAEQLAVLPHGAVLVNVGRGALVDEDALWAALQEDEGRRLAYGSDVWWRKTAAPAAPAERKQTEDGHFFPSKHPMHELDNVVMTPHMGGGKGLEGVESARVRWLTQCLEPIVKDGRWPAGSDVNAGY